MISCATSVLFVNNKGKESIIFWARDKKSLESNKRITLKTSLLCKSFQKVAKKGSSIFIFMRLCTVRFSHQCHQRDSAHKKIILLLLLPNAKSQLLFCFGHFRHNCIPSEIFFQPCFVLRQNCAPPKQEAHATILKNMQLGSTEKESAKCQSSRCFNWELCWFSLKCASKNDCTLDSFGQIWFPKRGLSISTLAFSPILLNLFRQIK